MGACMSLDSKSQRKSQNQQLEQKKPSIESPQTTKETCEHNSPQPGRLDEVKAKLPPLIKGIQKRERIMSMCEKSTVSNGKLKKGQQISRTQPCDEPQILQFKLNKQISLVKSEIFKQTINTLEGQANKENQPPQGYKKLNLQ